MILHASQRSSPDVFPNVFQGFPSFSQDFHHFPSFPQVFPRFFPRFCPPSVGACPAGSPPISPWTASVGGRSPGAARAISATAAAAGASDGSRPGMYKKCGKTGLGYLMMMMKYSVILSYYHTIIYNPLMDDDGWYGFLHVFSYTIHWWSRKIGMKW